MKKLFLKEEMALHFLLKQNPEMALKALKGEPLEAAADSEEQQMMDLAADPYFGSLGGPPMVPPIFNQPPPFMEQWGQVEEPPMTPDFSFPAFPVRPN